MGSRVDEPRRPVVLLKGTAFFVVNLFCAILILLALLEAYWEFGLSFEFASCFLAAIVIVVTLARLGGRIGTISCKILVITILLGHVAIFQFNAVFSITLAGTLILVVTVFVVLVSCDKYRHVEDYPLPVPVKEETGGGFVGSISGLV